MAASAAGPIAGKRYDWRRMLPGGQGSLAAAEPCGAGTAAAAGRQAADGGDGDVSAVPAGGLLGAGAKAPTPLENENSDKQNSASVASDSSNLVMPPPKARQKKELTTEPAFSAIEVGGIQIKIENVPLEVAKKLVALQGY